MIQTGFLRVNYGLRPNKVIALIRTGQYRDLYCSEAAGYMFLLVAAASASLTFHQLTQ